MVAAATGFLIAAAAAKIGALFSRNSARQARKRARRAQIQIQRIQNAQARRQFLRQFRGAQATALAVAGAQIGGLESSRARGQVASLVTQARFGLFEQGLQSKFSEIAQTNIARAERREFRAGVLSAISDFAIQGAGLYGGRGSTGGVDVTAGGRELAQMQTFQEAGRVAAGTSSESLRIPSFNE